MQPWRDRLNSNTWQTTFLVMLMVLVSVAGAIWFFWRSLYLPELKNHARYLGSELTLVNATRERWADEPEIIAWIDEHTHIAVVDDPAEFPDVFDKPIPGFFTDIMAREIGEQLGREVTVYFKFKPTPQLWVQDSQSPEFWIREPVVFYAQYSPLSLLFFVLGIPLLTILAIAFLVRQLNRPLRRLEQTARTYIQTGSATTLPTDVSTVEIQRVNMAFNRLFDTIAQAQKERTVMLAGISHDLRTPLTRMRLTAEMMPDEFLKEGLIYDVEDMDAILEQFISFMKDGSDEPIVLTDLDAIFQEIMVQFARTDFVYEADDLPAVPLRPLSIKRLIINLIVNAQRYGKPPIHLSAKIESINSANVVNAETLDEVTETGELNGTPQQLVICVRDCGEGVADDQLARILEPFERGETARTRQNGSGSGLGLAIVGRIARLHRGTVEARNHPEGGLQVCVRMPVDLSNTP